MVYVVSSRCMDTRISSDVREKAQSWRQWILCIISAFPFFTSTLQSSFIEAVDIRSQIDLSYWTIWFRTCRIGGAVVGAAVLCWAAERAGRKTAIASISFLQSVLCILIVFKTHLLARLFAEVFIGIATGGVYTVLPIYVSEISETKSSGISMLLMLFMSNFGDLIQEFLMTINKDDVILNYVMIGLMMLQLLLILIVVESPCYFVKKNNFEAAEKVLTRIKCLHQKDSIAEIKLSKLKVESENATSNGALTLWGILKHQIWRAGFKIGVALNTVHVLGGAVVLSNYPLLQVAPSVSLITAAVATGAGVVACVAVLFTQPKYMLSISYWLQTVSLGVLGVYLQVDDVEDASDVTHLVPGIALLVFLVAGVVATGVRVMVVVVMFNLEIRAKLVATIYIYAQILEIIFIHTFPYIKYYLGLHLLCYVFAGVNLYGAVYSLFALPLTNNMSVRQIERQLKYVPIWKE